MSLRPLDRTIFTALAAALGIGLTVGNWSGLVAAPAPPPPPAELVSSVSGSAVTLAWRAGAGTKGKVTYRLEAGSISGASDLAVATVSGTSIVTPDVPDGQYFVRVRAQNTGGTSQPSNEVVVRVGCVAAPPVPTGVVAQVNGDQVSIQWPPVAGADGYVLEAGSTPDVMDLGSLSLSTAGFSTAAPAGTYYLRVRAGNRCGLSAPSAVVTVSVGVPVPPPPPGGIFGIVDAAVLGTCSAATHDQWTVDGGDGFLYRTWHPQTDPSGCVYAHEHGDNPALMQDAEIASSPVRFGYIGRRHPMPGEPNGHEEAHEGFKVFIANRGDVNDEGRVNRVYSRSVFHMGTGGPRRFSMPHHSAEIRLVHPEFGLKAFTQLMMNTGGVAPVCDPRAPAPVKDAIVLGQPCRINSAYEIWSASQSVRFQGREVYRAFATPAVFDPITVFNPANPTEVVYAWDPRVAAVKNFTDDWSYFRGCDRESYAQPGVWHNGGGRTTYTTDAMGQELAATDPLALVQVISASDSVSAPATTDGLLQFKVRRGFCQQRSKLGLKN